jgi:hypothetical protein
LSAKPSFFGILFIRRLSFLPLHIAWVIGAASANRLNVVNHEIRASSTRSAGTRAGVVSLEGAYLGRVAGVGGEGEKQRQNNGEDLHFVPGVTPALSGPGLSS